MRVWKSFRHARQTVVAILFLSMLGVILRMWDMYDCMLCQGLLQQSQYLVMFVFVSLLRLSLALRSVMYRYASPVFQLGVVLVLCLIGRSLAGLVSGGGVLVAGMVLVVRSAVFG